MGTDMSEAISDPMAFTDEQPEPTPQEAPREETLGDGIIGDTFGEDSSEGTGQPEEESETSTPEPTETAEEKAGRLRYEDYTRKRQQDAEEMRQLREQIAEERRQLHEERLRLQQPAVQQELPPADSFRQIAHQTQQALQDPNLDPAHRQSLLAEYQGLTKLADLADKMAQFEAFQQQFKETYEPQFAAVQELTQRQQAELKTRLTSEYAEATKAFGEDVVQESGEFIRRNYGSNNPKTGKPYTIAELTSMASGQPIRSAEKVTAGNRQVRKEAKAAVAPTGADTSTNDKTALSREEALANW